MIGKWPEKTLYYHPLPLDALVVMPFISSTLRNIGWFSSFDPSVICLFWSQGNPGSRGAAGNAGPTGMRVSIIVKDLTSHALTWAINLYWFLTNLWAHRNCRMQFSVLHWFSLISFCILGWTRTSWTNWRKSKKINPHRINLLLYIYIVYLSAVHDFR